MEMHLLDDAKQPLIAQVQVSAYRPPRGGDETKHDSSSSVSGCLMEVRGAQVGAPVTSTHLGTKHHPVLWRSVLSSCVSQQVLYQNEKVAQMGLVKIPSLSPVGVCSIR